MRERVIWIVAGVAGLALAVGVAFVTANLTDSPVGLSSEPVSAGQALTPGTTVATTPQRARTTEPPTATRPADRPQQPAVTTEDGGGGDDNGGRSGSGSGSGEDSSGKGRGRGRGRGGDDD